MRQISRDMQWRALAVRIVSCFRCGIVAGLLVRFLKKLGRNIKAIGLYFLLGVLFSALFQRYVPAAGFMITGPVTKITNLGALKIVLGIRDAEIRAGGNQENVYHAPVLHYGRYQFRHSNLSAGYDDHDGRHGYGESPDGRGNHDGSL